MLCAARPSGVHGYAAVTLDSQEGFLETLDSHFLLDGFCNRHSLCNSEFRNSR